MILAAEPDIEIVGEAATGTEAVALNRDLRPDVVLMDIRMPELDGIEATRRILAQDHEPKPSVLILTTFDLDEYVYDALRAGASGFLLKDVPAPQLELAVVEYISWFNHARLHQSLGDIPPVEFEQATVATGAQPPEPAVASRRVITSTEVRPLRGRLRSTVSEQAD